MKEIKRLEKELKEETEHLEYIYHNISKAVQKRASMQRKINGIADRIIEIEKEIVKLKRKQNFKIIY